MARQRALRGVRESLMELQIEGRHFKITEAIQQFVEEKLGKLEKYFDGIHRVRVILDFEEARRQKAEVVCTVARRSTLVARGEAEDMYAAIDQAERKLRAELKKYKARLRPLARGGKRAEAQSAIGEIELAEEDEQEE